MSRWSVLARSVLEFFAEPVREGRRRGKDEVGLEDEGYVIEL